MAIINGIKTSSFTNVGKELFTRNGIIKVEVSSFKYSSSTKPIDVGRTDQDDVVYANSIVTAKAYVDGDNRGYVVTTRLGEGESTNSLDILEIGLYAKDADNNDAEVLVWVGELESALSYTPKISVSVDIYIPLADNDQDVTIDISTNPVALAEHNTDMNAHKDLFDALSNSTGFKSTAKSLPNGRKNYEIASLPINTITKGSHSILLKVHKSDGSESVCEVYCDLYIDSYDSEFEMLQTNGDDSIIEMLQVYRIADDMKLGVILNADFYVDTISVPLIFSYVIKNNFGEPLTPIDWVEDSSLIAQPDDYYIYTSLSVNKSWGRNYTGVLHQRHGHRVLDELDKAELATKDELALIPAPVDISHLATKAEISNLASKDGLTLNSNQAFTIVTHPNTRVANFSIKADEPRYYLKAKNGQQRGLVYIPRTEDPELSWRRDLTFVSFLDQRPAPHNSWGNWMNLKNTGTLTVKGKTVKVEGAEKWVYLGSFNVNTIPVSSLSGTGIYLSHRIIFSIENDQHINKIIGSSTYNTHSVPTAIMPSSASSWSEDTTYDVIRDVSNIRIKGRRRKIVIGSLATPMVDTTPITATFGAVYKLV